MALSHLPSYLSPSLIVSVIPAPSCQSAFVLSSAEPWQSPVLSSSLCLHFHCVVLLKLLVHQAFGPAYLPHLGTTFGVGVGSPPLCVLCTRTLHLTPAACLAPHTLGSVSTAVSRTLLFLPLPLFASLTSFCRDDLLPSYRCALVSPHRCHTTYPAALQ